MTAPAIPAAAFARRRARLMRRLPRDSAAIFGAGREARRNGDVDYPFRQRSSFYYLTGFEEPDAVAVLRPAHEQPFVLFVRPYDPRPPSGTAPASASRARPASSARTPPTRSASSRRNCRSCSARRGPSPSRSAATSAWRG